MKLSMVRKLGVALLGILMVVPVAQAQGYDRYGYRGPNPSFTPYKPPAPVRRYQPRQQPTRQAARQVTPDQLLRQGVEQTFSYLRRTGSTDLSNVLDFVNKELGPYFDFEHMTRLAAGKMSKDLDDAQVQKLSKKLEQMFMTALGQQIATYAYTNHRVTFYPAKRSRFGKEVSVAARITHPRGFPVKITFRFHPSDNGWKIYDVSANNNSAVMYYRKQLAMIAQRYGMDALLKQADG
ncbi:MAG: ABC transporter substrate-binding protein [Gammaproteobacteria bacterium]|jgi:phospholipid transport system substrate-binding protein|nr:ABC transporter substrate-binding protein [Gammaproteobacteria bacterium]MBT4608301.1 ABC transporter substrate-binding protein [Thiotrichales bacterium]MBT3471712.1 ABC transporter substrate-binding protein [Gammaproteobacteria bacterium]MBT3966849.1 ABC transporter substrate-binding protein [Gammaproteobacteria bacterium]MBT4079742.1 ABC transporter substrate-binding protein [Gammaproteobacteria bacterium]